MAGDWSKFTAFNGTLGPWILTNSIDGMFHDVHKFYMWLSNVVTDPASHGIMPRYVGDVKNLFKIFLIHGSSSEATTTSHPLLTSSLLLERTSKTDPEVLDPFYVNFGSNQNVIGIVDGAAALAYLFSVHEVPEGITPTCDNYWMPFLLLFSKCLYLSFLRPVNIGNDKWDNTGIPLMSNVMYLPERVGDDLTHHPFMFGATAASISVHKEKDDREILSKKNRIVHWRRHELLNPELQRMSPEFKQPLSQYDLRKLVQELNVAFVKLLKPGKMHPKAFPEMDIAAENVGKEVVKRVDIGDDTTSQNVEKDRTKSKQARKKDKKDGDENKNPRHTRVPYDQLISRATTKPHLVALLEEVIRRYYSLQGGGVVDHGLKALLLETFRYYWRPHIFPRGSAPSSAEVPLDPNED